jgi:hypothetical protein
MIPFTYRCPRTGQQVQGWAAHDLTKGGNLRTGDVYRLWAHSSRQPQELGYPRDSAASLYGHHRIAVVDFDFVWIHLPHAVCAAVILQRFRRTRAAGSGGLAWWRLCVLADTRDVL